MTVDRFENSQKSNQAGIIMSEECQKFQQKILSYIWSFEGHVVEIEENC